MKSLFIFLFLIFLNADVVSQCSPDEYTNECVPRLGEGINFLKAYKLDGDSGTVPKMEYSHLFTKGNRYMINLCAEGEGADGLVVTLYNSRKQQIATTFVNGKYVTALVFPCKATGIYYLSFTFRDSENYCGGSVLGFKKS